MQPAQRKTLKSLVTPPLIFLAAGIMWLEDTLFDLSTIVMARVARLRFVQIYEKLVISLPPYPAMVVFLLPGLGLLPVKISALWLMAQGHPGLGLLLVIGAKLLGTAIVARSFTLSKTKLLTIGWFSHFYTWLVNFRVFLYSRVQNHPLYRAARVRIAEFRARHAVGLFAPLISARWFAVQRRQQRARAKTDIKK